MAVYYITKNMNILKTKNSSVFQIALVIVAFSILFFFTPHKKIVAESYNTDSGRPASFYGVDVGSVSHGASAVPASVSPSGRYYNVSYVVNSAYYSGATYSGQTQANPGASYSGTSVSGGSIVPGGNSQGGSSSSGISYSGSISVGGGSTLGAFYSSGSNYSGGVSANGGVYSGSQTSGGASSAGTFYSGGSVSGSSVGGGPTYAGSSYSGGSVSGGFVAGGSVGGGPSYSGSSYAGGSVNGGSVSGSSYSGGTTYGSQVASVAYAPAAVGSLPNTGIGPGETIIVNNEIIPTSAARIRIPKINVNTAIEEVGLTKEGVVGVPNNVTDVGWLNVSSMPGQIGTAIVDGHKVSRHGSVTTKGVFDDLGSLQKGDKVYVEYSGRDSVTFVVKDIRVYDRNQAVPEVYSSDGRTSKLNLITCAGPWDTVHKTYTKRLVVFAEIVK